MSKEVFEEVFHPGNTLRVTDVKEYKKVINDLIFNKDILNIIKTLDIKKEIVILEEISDKANVDFEILREILWYLYENKLITFCSILPFTETEFQLDDSIKSLQRFQGIGLIDQKYIEDSTMLLEKTIPLINEVKYSLDEISKIVNEPPIKIKELLKRFKIDWLLLDLE
ncbi:MAG: hypothetical protein EAX96_03160 [Candidatus Lokiarchaeota archaeon]|nr:hypothetical protein [Candidatus Lokiarchaeota archaeon]